jgi:hypothetical protein
MPTPPASAEAGNWNDRFRTARRLCSFRVGQHGPGRWRSGRGACRQVRRKWLVLLLLRWMDHDGTGSVIGIVCHGELIGDKAGAAYTRDACVRPAACASVDRLPYECLVPTSLRIEFSYLSDKSRPIFFRVQLSSCLIWHMAMFINMSCPCEYKHFWGS